jgi:phytoene synthase
VNVQTAYAACQAITRGEARNFSYGIALLPAAQRRAMTAVYAAARRIDDIGDGDLPDAEKERALESLRHSLLAVRDADRPAADQVDPVLLALADAAERFPLPLTAFGEIVDGCLADVSVHSYRTFDELVEYCRCVAGAVGRLSVGIYRPRRLSEAWEPADALGVALQITNILRDVREDRLAGRIYLPAEDLERFGCRLDIDDSGALTDPPDAFAALIRFQAERAQIWYDRGAALLPLLDRRSAACTAAMAGIYHRLLGIIAADPDAVRTRRVSLPAAQKAAVAARALARGSW